MSYLGGKDAKESELESAVVRPPLVWGIVEQLRSQVEAAQKVACELETRLVRSSSPLLNMPPPIHALEGTPKTSAEPCDLGIELLNISNQIEFLIANLRSTLQRLQV